MRIHKYKAHGKQTVLASLGILSILMVEQIKYKMELLQAFVSLNYKPLYMTSLKK